jgi:hypothetical protein
VRIILLTKKRLSKPATQNPEAYQLYLKGRYYLSKRTERAKESHRLLQSDD